MDYPLQHHEHIITRPGDGAIQQQRLHQDHEEHGGGGWGGQPRQHHQPSLHVDRPERYDDDDVVGGCFVGDGGPIPSSSTLTLTEQNDYAAQAQWQMQQQCYQQQQPHQQQHNLQQQQQQQQQRYLHYTHQTTSNTMSQQQQFGHQNVNHHHHHHHDDNHYHNHPQPRQEQYQQQQQQQQPQSTMPEEVVASSSTSCLSKCDRVIYEAIAKACEIAVRSRCTSSYFVDDVDHDGSGGRVVGCSYGGGGASATRGGGGKGTWSYHGGGSAARNNANPVGNGNGNGATGGTGSGSSGRFNIEVKEVRSVRASDALLAWRGHAIHQHQRSRQPQQQRQYAIDVVIPLRLDVYYEHEGMSDAHQPPQRELLERWCIDYRVPNVINASATNSPYSSPHSSPYSSRIITTGAIPSSSSYSSNNDWGGRQGSSATGGGGGASQLRQACKRIVVLLRSMHCATRMLPAFRLRCLLRDMDAYTTTVGGGRSGWGTIGHTIHVGCVGSTTTTGVDPLFTSSLPSPSFALQSFPGVLTPGGGSLDLSVMYDATLDPHLMMDDIAMRREAWLMHMSHPTHHRQSRPEEQEWQYYEAQRYGAIHPSNLPYNAEGGVIGAFTSTSAPIPIGAHHPAIAGQQKGYHINSEGRIGGGGGVYYNDGVNGNSGNGMPVSGGSKGIGEHRSCPPTTAPPLSTSFGRRPRAVSDFIISDYQSSSPRLRPSPHDVGGTIGGTGGAGEGGGDNKRVMSGLSLAMMIQDDHTENNISREHGEVGANQQNRPPSPPTADNDVDGHHGGLSVLPFGSPATRRAAFHTPATMCEANLENDGNIQERQQRARSYTGGEGESHLFQRHGGYGYGYNNGSNAKFGEERPPPTPPPPPPPPQIKPAAEYGGGGVGLAVGCLMRPSNTTPPLQTIINRSRSGSIGRSRSGSIGTPPTSAHFSGSRQTSNPMLVSDSPKLSLAESKSGGIDVEQQSKNKHHQKTSSSSSIAQLSALLPPITSLDVLQKSPFIAAGRNVATTSTTVDEHSSHRSFGGPLIGSQQRPRQDEMAVFLHSIPRMVPSSSLNEERNNSSIGAVSTLCSEDPEIPGSSRINSVTSRSSSVMPKYSEEFPFAVDEDDAQLASEVATGTSIATPSPSPPLKSLVASRSLWGSNIDGPIGGVGVGGMAEIATSLAVSSLHHRCATDGKIRLKMFEGSYATRTAKAMYGSSMAGGGVAAGKNDHGSISMRRLSAAETNEHADRGGDGPSSDFTSMQDQLSDFRSFGASLMICSANHEGSQ